MRIYVTGDCDGLADVKSALAEHEEVELVGASEGLGEAAGALAGGHLEAVVHATRASAFPAEEVAAIREHTAAPLVLLASGEGSGMLDDALDAGIADVLLLPQLTDSLVFALRKAGHAGRRAVRDGQSRPGRKPSSSAGRGCTGRPCASPTRGPRI